MATRKPKVVVIGGGTGSFAVLSGLKSLDCDLTALVNMVDDGGSTGQLRDEYGVLPPGDVRQCLVALSQAPESLRSLFNFRFPAGGALAGHSFGNLFLSAIEMRTSNFLEAVEMASEVLSIRGRVLPVTTEKCQLVMTIGGRIVVGQNKINGEDLGGVRPTLSLKPAANITPEAAASISEADMIIIAPGNLYTSIIPALLVNGMTKELKLAKAKVVYLCNLVNKPKSTTNFKVSDYVEEIEKVAGKGAIDYVLYNVDNPSEALLKKYAKDNEYPVIVDEDVLRNGPYTAIPGKLLSHKGAEEDMNDVLLKERSLLRHDSKALTSVIESIMYKEHIS